MGGAVGLGLTSLLVDTTAAWLPLIAPDLPRVDEISVHWPVAGLAIVLICSTGILCGLVPALAGMNPGLVHTLRDRSMATGYGRHQHRLRALLVVAEAALAMLLLVGSGLLLRSFVRMLNVNPGFQPEGVMTASLALPKEGYRTQEKVDEFLGNLERKIEVMAGVQAVGFSTDIPVIGRNSSRLFAAQDYVPNPIEGFSLAANYLVSGDYFAAFRIPLIKGRYFAATDDLPHAPLVAIISQSFARRYFPGRDPVGMSIKVGPNYNSPMPTIGIVGVVGDVSDNPLDQQQDIEMYEPVSQAAEDLGPYGNIMGVVGSLRVVARTAGDPRALGALLIRTVHDADPLLAVTEMKTMDEVVAGTQTSRRFSTSVLTAFAAVALLLALLGIYGVQAYSVAECRREIAIRMALGASRGDVQRRVLLQALVLGLSGIAVGLVASAGLTRYLMSLLYDVQALDRRAILGAIVILLSCTLFAGWLPARRAASVDPMRTLRTE
jgi:predicted permease